MSLGRSRFGRHKPSDTQTLQYDLKKNLSSTCLDLYKKTKQTVEQLLFTSNVNSSYIGALNSTIEQFYVNVINSIKSNEDTFDLNRTETGTAAFASVVLFCVLFDVNTSQFDQYMAVYQLKCNLNMLIGSLDSLVKTTNEPVGLLLPLKIALFVYIINNLFQSDGLGSDSAYVKRIIDLIRSELSVLKVNQLGCLNQSCNSSQNSTFGDSSLNEIYEPSTCEVITWTRQLQSCLNSYILNYS